MNLECLLVCARIGLWSDKCSLKTASDQTIPDQIDLWSDRPRLKWSLIRQVPDHWPDKIALEAFSRPCNSSAPRTCVCSKMIWSELNSVWPPRLGWHSCFFILLCLLFRISINTTSDPSAEAVFFISFCEFTTTFHSISVVFQHF